MTILPYDTTITPINAEEKYSHLPSMKVNCLLCRERLGSVAYRLHIPGRVADGAHYIGIGAEFCSEEHAQSWLETEYKPPTRALLTDGIPTQETHDIWIYAFRKIGDYPKNTERSGKWLIWLSAQTIDRYWHTPYARQSSRDTCVLGEIVRSVEVSGNYTSGVILPEHDIIREVNRHYELR